MTPPHGLRIPVDAEERARRLAANGERMFELLANVGSDVQQLCREAREAGVDVAVIRKVEVHIDAIVDICDAIEVDVTP